MLLINNFERNMPDSRPARCWQRSWRRRRCYRSHGSCAQPPPPPRLGVSWPSNAVAAWCTWLSPGSKWWRRRRTLAGETLWRWIASATCHCSRRVVSTRKAMSLWWCMLGCWISFPSFSNHSKNRFVNS